MCASSKGIVSVFFCGDSSAISDLEVRIALSTKRRNRQRSFRLAVVAFRTEDLDWSFLFLSEEFECQGSKKG